MDQALAIQWSTSGLNGGPLGGFHLDELPPSESLNCPPFGGWWAKLLFGTCVGKPSPIQCISILIGAMVIIEVVTYCRTCPMFLLMTNWTTLVC